MKYILNKEKCNYHKCTAWSVFTKWSHVCNQHLNQETEHYHPPRRSLRSFPVTIHCPLTVTTILTLNVIDFFLFLHFIIMESSSMTSFVPVPLHSVLCLWDSFLLGIAFVHSFSVWCSIRLCEHTTICLSHSIADDIWGYYKYRWPEHYVGVFLVHIYEFLLSIYLEVKSLGFYSCLLSIFPG